MKRPEVPNYKTKKVFDIDYVFELNRYIEFLEQKINVLNKEDKTKNYCLTIDRCGFKNLDLSCRKKGYCNYKQNGQT